MADINRLIIIGNGFDLAHGLPTRYTDFLQWYFEQVAHSLLNGELYHDALVQVKPSSEYRSESIHYVAQMFKLHEPFHYSYFLKLSNPKLQNPLIFTLSDFIRDIMQSSADFGWVNIEHVFYNKLIEILSKHDLEGIVSVKKFSEEIEQLNKGLNQLSIKLKQYLVSIQEENIVNYSSDFVSIFEAGISERLPFAVSERIEKRDSYITSIPDQTRVLNFNYTSSVEEYFAQDEVIYIHGRCDSEDSIIFGYGDERDENYKKLEMTGIDEVLDHMKSFGYFQSSAYQDLMTFVEANEFQVFIIGHSCGLSDRTLLSHIFEHKNCISISPFYHEDKKNYVRLTQNISRHFDDKILMRQKVEPFSEELMIPKLTE